MDMDMDRYKLGVKSYDQMMVAIWQPGLVASAGLGVAGVSVFGYYDVKIRPHQTRGGVIKP